MNQEDGVIQLQQDSHWRMSVNVTNQTVSEVYTEKITQFTLVCRNKS